MRLFFGLPAEGSTALEISDWRDRNLSCNASAVPPANFHITLAFVGATGEQELERLCDSVDAVFQNGTHAAGELNLQEVGFWPKPGILWLGPRTWPQSLTDLAKKLRHLAVGSGARRDRNRFQPHITLFRRCQSAPALPPAPPSIHFSYDHLTLFESRQGRSGVSYHSVCEWPLGHL